MQWVRTGHDPAIFYDPTTDTFDELQGNGVALGIEESWRYAENEKTGLAEGQIIFIGTDGIWETKNAQDQMFGKDPIFEIIRQHSKARAEDIMKAVISALNRFRGDLSPEDDVTLMVIKIGGGTSSQPSLPLYEKRRNPPDLYTGTITDFADLF